MHFVLSHLSFLKVFPCFVYNIHNYHQYFEMIHYYTPIVEMPSYSRNIYHGRQSTNFLQNFPNSLLKFPAMLNPNDWLAHQVIGYRVCLTEVLPIILSFFPTAKLFKWNI